MNWDDLKVFLDVVRQPKLEQTATKLNIDATTISRRLKRLETDLGTTLFERTRRGHMLTPSGEALAKQVENMESLAFDIASKNAGFGTIQKSCGLDFSLKNRRRSRKISGKCSLFSSLSIKSAFATQ